MFIYFSVLFGALSAEHTGDGDGAGPYSKPSDAGSGEKSVSQTCPWSGAGGVAKSPKKVEISSNLAKFDLPDFILLLGYPGK